MRILYDIVQKPAVHSAVQYMKMVKTVPPVGTIFASGGSTIVLRTYGPTVPETDRRTEQRWVQRGSLRSRDEPEWDVNE